VAGNLIEDDDCYVRRSTRDLALDFAALLRDGGGQHDKDASGGQAESPVSLKMTAHHVPT
jgi:hypothetical protein